MRAAIVLVLVMLTNAPAFGAPKRVLVLDTKATGVPESVGPTVTGQIVEILGMRPEIIAINLAELDDLLALEQDKRLMSGCEEDIACLAKISEAAKAELALSSSVGMVGDSVVVSITVMDAKRAEAVGRATETFADVDAVLPALPGLLAQAFGWEGGGTVKKFKLPEGKKLSLAIFELKPTGVPEEIARNLTQILSTELNQLEGTKVISSEDIDAMLQLEQDKVQLGCNTDMSCMAEIGGALGVDKLIVGQVGQLAQSYVVSLRLIDVRRAVVDSRVTETFKGQRDQLLLAIRFAGRNLLGVEAEDPGTLVVSAGQVDSELTIDDEVKGSLPLPPIPDLTPGRHSLLISKGGYYTWRSDVYVEPGATSAVWADMEAKPTWWAFWGTSIGAGTSAVAAITFGILAQYNASEFQRLAKNGRKPGLRTQSYNRAQTFQTTANVFYVSTGVLGAAAVAFGLLTDWE